MVEVDLAGCEFVYLENFFNVVFANLRWVEDQRKFLEGEKNETASDGSLNQLSHTSVLSPKGPREAGREPFSFCPSLAQN